VTDPGRPRLLLVDDDQVDRQIVRRTLKRSGLRPDLTEVAGLAAAREALEASPGFDCVLLDHRLPDGEGLDLLRDLEEGEPPPAPIVILTGHDEGHLAEACLQAGAQDYLVKGSFDDDALARAIRYARERWRLLRRLRAQAVELQRSNVELEQFAHIVSHDLQEPLRSVRRFSERLGAQCSAVLDEKGRHYLDRILAGSERMEAMIRDLLSLSRVGSGPLDLESVRLADVLDAVENDLAERIDATGAEVRREGLDRAVSAAPSRVHQLLLNLVGNALKFHREGEPPRVTVSAGPGRRGWVAVSVADEGIGFDAKQAERVFQPFRRLRPNDYEGTGIGLPICKKIVELHGGQIAAEPRAEGGAAFRFTLPAAP